MSEIFGNVEAMNPHLDRIEREVLEIVPEFLHPLLSELKEADTGTYIHSLEAAMTMYVMLNDFKEDDRGVPITQEDIVLATTGAALHDIGKVQDTDITALINVPRPLYIDEIATVSRHAPLGASRINEFVLDHLDSKGQMAFTQAVSSFAEYHHAPYNCPDTSLRQYVELLHIVDRGLGMSDVNRAYLMLDERRLLTTEAFNTVWREMKSEKRNQQYFNRSLGEITVVATSAAMYARAA